MAPVHIFLFLGLVVPLRAAVVSCLESTSYKSYKYVRFTPIRLRGTSESTMQLGMIMFKDSSTDLVRWADVVTAPCSSAPNYGYGSTRTVSEVNDNSFSFRNYVEPTPGPVLFEWTTPFRFDEYTVYSSTDMPERDPVEWVLHASADNVDWVLLHDNRDEWAMPWHRSSTKTFKLNSMSFRSIRWVPLHFMQESIEVQTLRFYHYTSQMYPAGSISASGGSSEGTPNNASLAVSEAGVWIESNIVPLVVYSSFFMGADSYSVVVPTENASSNPQRFLLQVRETSSWLQAHETEVDVTYSAGISQKFALEGSSCSPEIKSVYVSKLRFSVVTLSSQTTATALELAELQIYANGFILQNLSAATVTPAGDVSTEATFAFDTTAAGYASKMREPVEVALQQSISIEGYRFITSGTAGTPIRWELHGESSGRWFIVHQMENDASTPNVNTASPMYYVNPLNTIRSLSIRYVRFTPLALRSYTIDGTGQYQATAPSSWILSELEFLSSYNVISPTSAAGAVALTDGDYTTELSVNGLDPVTIDLGLNPTWGSYYSLQGFRLVTASSTADHDPVQFRIEGSTNGATYYVLYEQLWSTALDLARMKASPWFYVTTTTTTTAIITMTDGLTSVAASSFCGLSTPVTTKYLRLVLRNSRALLSWDDIGGWQIQELYFFDIFGNQLDLAMATVFCENDDPNNPSSNAVDRDTTTKFVSEYMSDLLITFQTTVEVYAWQVMFGADSISNQDPLKMDLQSSVDGNNWFVVDHRQLYPGRWGTLSPVLRLEPHYSTLGRSVQSVEFRCNSPRQWNAWVGVRNSTEWRVTEIEFLVGDSTLSSGNYYVQLIGGGLSTTLTHELSDGNVYTPSGSVADSSRYIKVTFYNAVMLQAFRFHSGNNQHQDCAEFNLTGTLAETGADELLFEQIDDPAGIPYQRSVVPPWYYLGHQREETSTTTATQTYTTSTYTTRTSTSGTNTSTSTGTSTTTTSTTTTSTTRTSTTTTSTSMTSTITSTTSKSDTSSSTTQTSSRTTSTSSTRSIWTSSSTTSSWTISSSTSTSNTNTTTTTSTMTSSSSTSSTQITSSTSSTSSASSAQITSSTSSTSSTPSTSTFTFTSNLFPSTTSTTTPPSALTQALTEAAEAVEQGMQQATQDLLSNLTNTSTGGLVLGRTTLDSGDFSFTATAIDISGAGDSTEVSLEFDGGVKVILDLALVEAFGGLVVLAVGQPGDGNEIVNGSQGPSDVLAMTAIGISLPNGSAIRGDLPLPLRFELTRGPDTEGNLSCSYWDEGTLTWSERGVRLVSISADGNSITCETTHLSIFAVISKAFLAALFCSNAATIFSLEGLQSLGKRPWILEMPAIFNLVVIFIGLVLMYCARRADLRQKERVHTALNLLHLQDAKTKHSHGILGSIMDQIVLSWRHPALFIYSSEVQRATGMSISRLMVMYEHTGHGMLHGIAEESLRKMNRTGLKARVLLWYQVNCKWLKILHVNLHSTCCMRCAVLLAKVYSGWAMSAMFFDASAIAPGADEGCVPPETLLERIFTSFFVSVISTLVGAMPLVLLVVLFQRERVPKRVRLLAFWGFTIPYFLVCAMMIAIFLASVSPHDGTKWLASSLMGLGIDLLLYPLALTLLFSIILTRYSEEEIEVLPWERHEFDLYHVQGCEMVVQCRRQAEFTATCEVAGHPNTAISMEIHVDRGTSFRFPSGEFLELKSKQQILFSVYEVRRPRPPKLFGRAAVKMDDLVHRDFKGTLHLQLNHHEVKDAAVGVSIPRAKGAESAAGAAKIDVDMATVDKDGGLDKVRPSGHGFLAEGSANGFALEVPPGGHEMQERKATIADAPKAKDAEELQKVEEVSSVPSAIPASKLPNEAQEALEQEMHEAHEVQEAQEHVAFLTLEVEPEESDAIPHEALPMVARDLMVTVMRPTDMAEMENVDDVELEEAEEAVTEEVTEPEEVMELISASLEPDTPPTHTEAPSPEPESPAPPTPRPELETVRQEARKERARIEAQREQADPEVQKLWGLAEKRKLPPRETDGRTGT